MRVMTDRDAKILDTLIEFAGGDALLVQEAFERCSTRNAEHRKTKVCFAQASVYIYRHRKSGISLDEYYALLESLEKKPIYKSKFFQKFFSWARKQFKKVGV